jgi:CHAT domain-containing protein
MEELAKKVGRYRSEISEGKLDFKKQGRDIYDLLIKPASPQLTGKANFIIIPDGPLWELPFQALLDEKDKALIEKAAVSYAPSLTALREMSKEVEKRRTSSQLELFAIGNPIVGDATSAKVRQVFMSEKMEPLPEAERLVNVLGTMYGASRSRVYTGDAAREAVAKTEAPKYRVVQFATHGILNDVSPMYSHIVLSRKDGDPSEDGLLEAWEMKDLDLKADMVILSACETARGKLSSGEGVIGMTWAMFIAGAPTTVASQWKVESSSTTELMLEFHRQLLAKKKVSKAEALRRASLKVMKTPGFSHPSYWAGFVIVGDGS